MEKKIEELRIGEWFYFKYGCTIPGNGGIRSTELCIFLSANKTRVVFRTASGKHTAYNWGGHLAIMANPSKMEKDLFFD